MAKRTIEVDEAEIAAAEKRLSEAVDAEVRKSLEGPTTMEPADKIRLEAAEKKANDAATEAATLKTRLETLEKCASDLKTVSEQAKARFESEQKGSDEETTRRAGFIADHRGIAKDLREAEVKRLAGLGRGAVDEILRSTPAPRADSNRFTQRRESAPKKAEHIARRLESHPDGSGETMSLTVQDWSHYDSGLNADGTKKKGV